MKMSCILLQQIIVSLKQTLYLQVIYIEMWAYESQFETQHTKQKHWFVLTLNHREEISNVDRSAADNFLPATIHVLHDGIDIYVTNSDDMDLDGNPLGSYNTDPANQQWKLGLLGS